MRERNPSSLRVQFKNLLSAKYLAMMLVGLGLVWSSACSRPPTPTARSGPISVRLATSKNLWCSLSVLAIEKGYFNDEGLDVQPNYLEAGRYCMDAVISGSAEFGNVVEVNVAYLGYTESTDVRIIGTIVESTSSAIIARKSRGIATPQDLKGKSLAYSPGTTSDVFTRRFLAKYGLKTTDVELRKLQPLAMQAAMSDKGLDAASTWQPFVYNIRRLLGEDAVEFRDPQIYVGYENIAVRQSWANKNREAVRRFMNAISRSQKLISENPADAKSTLARAINLDPQIVESTWPEYKIGLTLDAARLVKDITAIGRSIQETQEEYKGKAVPDYSAFVDASYIGNQR